MKRPFNWSIRGARQIALALAWLLALSRVQGQASAGANVFDDDFDGSSFAGWTSWNTPTTSVVADASVAIDEDEYARVARSGQDEGVYFTFGPVASGVTVVEWAARPIQTDRNAVCTLFNNEFGTRRVGAGFGNTGRIRYLTTNGWANVSPISSYTSNTWYRFRLEIDETADTYDFYLNNAVQELDVPMNNPSPAQLGAFRAILELADPAIAELDDVEVYTHKKWVGAGSTNWNAATNWAPNGVPGATDDVRITDADPLDGQGLQPTLTASTTIGGLFFDEINSGGNQSSVWTGILTIAGTTTLDVNGEVAIESGAMLRISGAGTLECAGDFTLDGSYAGTNGTIVFDGNTTIGGTSSLIPGALVVSGSATLLAGSVAGGATTISNGQFLVHGILTNGSATATAGGTLGGTGIVAGAVTVEQDGCVTAAATNGVGQLALGSTLALNGQYQADVAGPGTNDVLAVTGAVTGSGSVDVLLAGGFQPDRTMTWTLIAGGPGSDYAVVTGNLTVNGMSNPSYSLEVDGNDLVLRYVLEPPPLGEAVVLQTYFVPLPEDDLQHSFEAIDNYAGNIGNEMRTIISIVPSHTNTIIYYDHWEDGYEADITSPVQTSSEVWGDNNPANGIPPGFTADIVNAGDIVNLEATIDVTRNEVNIEYDGRDKFSVTKAVAMSRAMYAIEPGEVLAGSVQVFDTSQYGLVYRAPAGYGTGTPPNASQNFEYCGLSVMAAHDYTRVEIDKDNDGTADVAIFLNEGQVYHVHGGVYAGAAVTATRPVQCHLISGDVGSNYEMRWFTLWPRYQWGSDYYTPVGARNDGGTIYGTFVYLFNPNETAITVQYQNVSGSGSVNVPANSTSAAVNMPQDSGAHFWTTNEAKFLALQLFDAYDTMQAYDWGLGLPPRATLTTASILGWGPGFGSTGGTNHFNANPVWATAVSDTTLYIDTDADPATGPYSDPLGNRYDYATNIGAFGSVQLFDDADNDQTGMRVYTTDGTHIVTAWGEDPVPALAANPYLDMGNVILPFPTVLATKHGLLFIDENGDGIPNPGDSLQFTIEIVNVGFATAHNVTLFDDGSTNATLYTEGSTTVNDAPFADDSVPPSQTVFPLDEGGADIGTIDVGTTSVVSYVVRVLNPFPTNIQNSCIYNGVSVVETNGAWSTVGFDCVNRRGLSLTKETSTTDLLGGGETLTYTITIANTGTLTYTGMTLEDLLPLGVGYVPGSARIYYPIGITNTLTDRFDERAYTNNDGTVGWRAGWHEAGESDGVNAGDVTVSADTGSAPLESYALEVSGAANGAWREADLSSYANAFLSFDHRREGLDDAADWVAVFASSNGGAAWTELARFTGAADDAAYAATNIEISAYISTNTAIRFYSSTGAGMAADDAVWFDNVTLTIGGGGVTNDGFAPPAIFEDYSLPPGTSMVVTLEGAVSDPLIATQMVNHARVRALQHPDWLDAYATNAGLGTVGITLSKTVSTPGLVNPGDVLTYTIDIVNTGDLRQTGIVLEDILPRGVRYVERSAEVWRPFTHSNAVYDRFDRKAYTNDDGNVYWAGSWQELGEADGAKLGNAVVLIDADSVPESVYALRLGAADCGVWRTAELNGYTNAVLSMDYRRDGLDDANDYVAVYASSNAGGAWTELFRLEGAGTDGSYVSTNHDITAYIGTNTAVRLLCSGTMGMDDYVWFDNVRIDYAGPYGTNGTWSPTSLFEAFFLPPGTNMTVRLDVTVDDPPTATQMVNTARMRSDQHPAWLYADATNSVNATAGLTVAKTSSRTGMDWAPSETNRYTITISNTGTVRQTAIELRDPNPTGATYVASSTVIVSPEGGGTNTIRDEFNAISYAGDDGTRGWASAWGEGGVESGDDPNAGTIQVQNDAGSFQLRFQNDNQWLRRMADLSGHVSATLSLFYRRDELEAGEYVDLEISASGFGGPWTQLARFAGAATDTSYISTNFDITAYIATNTAIRFENPDLGMGDADRVWFDDVAIAIVEPPTVTNTGNPPPTLAEGYALDPGESMTVTFEATADLPALDTNVVNTAFVTSDQQPELQASVTDTVVTVALGDFVWHDANTNGVQDVGESGLSNITVRLYDGATNLLHTTATTGDGAYAFGGMPPGALFLEFVAPTSWVFSGQGGGTPEQDSDPDPATGRTAIFTLTKGTNDTTRDAGLVLPSATLGDFVWYDANTNGVQDGGETGATNVTVRLYDAGSNLLATTSTDSAGAYVFTNVAPFAYYFVEFARPTGYVWAPRDATADDADSDPHAVTGRTVPFYATPGTNDTTRDAGLVTAGGGLAIAKTSSVATSAEPGDTVTYAITVTNTGAQTHTGIGVYDLAPTGTAYMASSTWVVAPSTPVTNTVRDNFDARSWGNNDGTTNWLADWIDSEGNGPTTADLWVLTDGTNADYQFQFRDDQRSLRRQVDISGATSATLSFRYRRDSLDDANDGVDLYISTNNAAPWTLLDQFLGQAGGLTDPDYTAVNYDITGWAEAGTTIAFYNPNRGMGNDDIVWFDDVEVAWVIGGSGTSTNAGGPPPDLATGYTLGPGETMDVRFDVTLENPGVLTQIMNTATAYSDIQTPITATATDPVVWASIGDFVWYDENVDGVQNGGESGISNVTVRLYDADTNLLLTTGTATNGWYAFTGLGSGVDYFLEVDAGTNYVATLKDEGGDDALDSDFDMETARTEIFSLAKGTNDTSRDAGLADPASVGNFVWYDANTNGVQDGGEPGFSNVIVRLYDLNTNLQAETTTELSGLYLFAEVPFGVYFLEFVAPTGWTFTLPDQAGDDEQDSDPDKVTGHTAFFSLPPAGSLTDLSRDAGLLPAGSGLGITKVSDTGGSPREPGATIHYTITVVNTGTVTHAGVGVDDFIPPDTTYVPGSAEVISWDVVTRTVRDEFGAVSYANNDGTNDWLAMWQETSDDGDPGNGTIQVVGDELRCQELGAGDVVDRSVDLSGALTASFTYDWRVAGLEETIAIYVASNAAGPFDQLATYTGDSGSGSGSHDILAYATTNTTVRFGNPGAGWNYFNDQAFFDDVQIEWTVSSIVTNPGSAPVDLTEGHTLATGQALVVSFDVTVDTPVSGTQLVNTATAYGDTQAPISDTVTDTLEVVTIGDYAWYDNNPMNGVQAPGEGPIADITVSLYGDTTNLLASTTTDTNGYYEFSGYPSGDYLLRFETGTNYVLTLADEGDDDTVDSDPDQLTGWTRPFSLTSPTNDTRWDAGLVKPGVVGDLVWYDANTNGIQDLPEAGATNVTVRLYDETGALVDTTVTLGSGRYLFDDLAPGDYCVEFTAPAGYIFTIRDNSANDEEDSDADRVTGKTGLFAVPATTNFIDLTRDAGLLVPVPGLTVEKSSDAAGCLAPGDTLTYTLTISNTGTVTQTGIDLYDAIPTAGVTYMAGSVDVDAPHPVTNTVTDPFGSRAWTNSGGTIDWSDAWSEEGDDGNPRAGAVYVSGSGWAAVGGPSNGLHRGVDLAAEYTSAMLSFDYSRGGLDDTNDYVAVYASSNAGASWSRLGLLAGPSNEFPSFLSTNYDITAFLSSNTTVRFASAQGLGLGELVAFDNVRIDAAGTPGAPPPYLAQGYVLHTGETMTATFEATVDIPPSGTQLVNEATVVSDLHGPLSATVTDCVVYADLAVDKTVDHPNPAEGDLVTYTIVLTNLGPSEATSVELTDILPGGVIYSNHTASTGTYDSVSGVWDVGTLPVATSETLSIQATIDTNTATTIIDNWAEVTQADQYDPVGWNNEDHADTTPTFVMVTAFRAYNAGDRTIVEWETGSERQAIGFDLLLREPALGPYVRLNDRLLPGLLTAPQGGVYRFAHRQLAAGASASYKLIETESTGGRRSYGPFTVTVAEATAEQLAAARNLAAFSSTPHPRPAFTQQRLAQWDQSRPGPMRPSAAVAAAAGSGGPAIHATMIAAAGGSGTADRIRISVVEDRLYHLSAFELAGLFGNTPMEVWSLLQNHGLRLSSRGAEIAYHVGAFGLYFFGRGSDSIYTRENVYWLAPGPGLPMQVVDGAGPPPAAPGQSFPDTLHFEEEHYALTALFADPESDFWLWDYLAPPWLTERVFDLNVPAPAANSATPAELTLHLQGATDTPVAPEHDTTLRLGDDLLARAKWDGKTNTSLAAAFPQELLSGGLNPVTVAGALPAGAPFSVFYVDSFDLTYARRYEADSDRLECVGAGHAVVTVGGFSDPNILVLDITDPDRPLLVRAITLDETNGVYLASFVPVDPATPYFVASANGVSGPANASGIADSTLRVAGNRAHYVIVCPDSLAQAAEALAEFRRAQELEVMVVTVEETYDAFNDGLVSPHAIRAFLQYADAHWEQAPRFVLLAGNGTYDYRDNLELGTCLVPPLMVRTPYGLHTSDNRLADLDDDGMPDLAIGRLPVLTPEELQGAVTKIVAYESGDNWKQNVVLCADNQDLGGDFPRDSRTVSRHVPEGFGLQHAYLPEQTVAEARALVLSGLTNGCRILNYLGHATRTRLAAENLLEIEDLSGIANASNAPIVLGMSCTLGRFAVPGYDSLGRALAAKPDGGAVAVWAPVGLAWNTASTALDDALFEALFTAKQARFGEAVLDALRARAPVGSPQLDMYALLGDPALRLEYWSGADSDGDGLPDGIETGTGLFVDETDTGTGADNPDSDGDTVLDGDELTRGTNPHAGDSDGDGFGDGQEIAAGTSPIDPDSYPVSGLTVAEPPAGSWVLAGGDLTVAWHGAWPLQNVDIDLTNTVAAWPLARGLASPQTSMTWQATVPWQLRYAADYRIAVRSVQYPDDAGLSAPFTVRARARGDFDGDGLVDPALYYPQAGMWYLLRSMQGFGSVQFGWHAPQPAPADYDGDGATDVALYHAPTGLWYLLKSTEGFSMLQFGYDRTLPVHRDYDGDGMADLALFDPFTGMWYVMGSTRGFRAAQFGWHGPLPVPADYDGDRMCDLAVYDPNTGNWYLLMSTDGFEVRRLRGAGLPVVPVPGDYDGDGTADPALYEPARGMWYIRLSTTQTTRTAQFGWAAAVPVPGDYDGDGITDIAVYHPQTGRWYIMKSAAGLDIIQFGWSAAMPVLAPEDHGP